MSDQLALLVQLQDLDLQLHQIKGEQKRIPEKLNTAEQHLEMEKTVLTKIKATLELANKEKREEERELVLCEEKIKKSKSRLTDLKTNKEYQAHLHEIEAAKRELGNIEEQLLLGMDKVDSLKKEMSVQEAAVAAEESRFTTERDQMEHLMERLLESARQVEAAWTIQTSGVEPKLLEEYKRLMVQKRLAVVAVKDNNCGGCHFRLPPQLIAEVKRREKLLTCDYCYRFLYVIA